MERIIKKIKQLETPQIVISLVMLGCAVFVGYGVFKPSGENKKEQLREILEFPETETAVQDYNSKLEAYELREKKESSLELKFDNTLFGSDNDGLEPDVYAEEEDERIKELQRQILLMEEKRRNIEGKNPRATNKVAVANQAETPPKTKEQLEMDAMRAEQEYYELLKKTKAEMTSGGTRAEIADKGATEPFRASIYRDQFILPGDRVKLLLNEDVEINGNIFKRNTIVYGTANINRSRVLLDVDNINHVPVSLEIRDIDDGAIGLYNKRAGELWREFQGQVQQDASRDIGQDISRDVNLPLIGSAVRAFNNFFRRKRYKEADKILLVNDHQLLISLKTTY